MPIEPILAIEQNSFQRPWGRLSFEGELRNRSACNYAVKSTEVKSSGQVIGYAFWHLVADEVHVLKVAVTPAWRGQGFACRLLERCFTSSVELGANRLTLKFALRILQQLSFIKNSVLNWSDDDPNIIQIQKRMHCYWLKILPG